MIDDKLKALMERPVVIILGSRSALGLPAVGRALALRTTADESALDVMTARGHWPDAVGHLAEGDLIAVTLCDPLTYTTYQVKGPVRSITPADGADLLFTEAAIAGTKDVLRQVGAPDAHLSTWLNPVDLIRIRIAPDAIFQQTPGPDAGKPIEAPA